MLQKSQKLFQGNQILELKFKNLKIQKIQNKYSLSKSYIKSYIKTRFFYILESDKEQKKNQSLVFSSSIISTINQPILLSFLILGSSSTEVNYYTNISKMGSIVSKIPLNLLKQFLQNKLINSQNHCTTIVSFYIFLFLE